MREFVAGFFTLGAAVVAAGVTYQVLHNPAVPTAGLQTVNTVVTQGLFKG